VCEEGVCACCFAIPTLSGLLDVDTWLSVTSFRLLRLWDRWCDGPGSNEQHNVALLKTVSLKRDIHCTLFDQEEGRSFSPLCSHLCPTCSTVVNASVGTCHPFTQLEEPVQTHIRCTYTGPLCITLFPPI
jgi:hypothetical protein